MDEDDETLSDSDDEKLLSEVSVFLNKHSGIDVDQWPLRHLTLLKDSSYNFDLCLDFKVDYSIIIGKDMYYRYGILTDVTHDDDAKYNKNDEIMGLLKTIHINNHSNFKDVSMCCRGGIIQGIKKKYNGYDDFTAHISAYIEASYDKLRSNLIIINFSTMENNLDTHSYYGNNCPLDVCNKYKIYLLVSNDQDMKDRVNWMIKNDLSLLKLIR